jgi:hypothetical protein
VVAFRLNNLVSRAERNAGCTEGILRFPFRDSDQTVAVFSEVGQLDADTARSKRRPTQTNRGEREYEKREPTTDPSEEWTDRRGLNH